MHDDIRPSSTDRHGHAPFGWQYSPPKTSVCTQAGMRDRCSSPFCRACCRDPSPTPSTPRAREGAHTHAFYKRLPAPPSMPPPCLLHPERNRNYFALSRVSRVRVAYGLCVRGAREVTRSVVCETESCFELKQTQASTTFKLRFTCYNDKIR